MPLMGDIGTMTPLSQSRAAIITLEPEPPRSETKAATRGAQTVKEPCGIPKVFQTRVEKASCRVKTLYTGMPRSQAIDSRRAARPDDLQALALA